MYQINDHKVGFNKRKGEGYMRIGLILGMCAWVLIGSLMAGCAVPLLLGVKSYKSGDTEVQFITGADFTIGANGVDTVDNARGIKPGRGANREKVEAVKNY